MSKLIEVKNLKTCFQTPKGIVTAVDSVSMTINKGETLGIVGESGCGKSITSLSIMRLVPSPHGKIISGEIIFDGEDILKKSETEMRKIRGNNIAMIFQEPMTSLNPFYTCGNQIIEVLRLHRGMTQREAMQKAVELLRLVGISSPEQRVREYPHQLSGGMRQRVMIAMALSCNPQLLIADEPTTALDVTIQAQILDLIKKIKQELGMAVMLITHDLGVIAEMAERVIVMYAGRIVEEAKMETILRNPLHPYTEGLINSIPHIHEKREKLYSIAGTVPSLLNLPSGCRFSTRCQYVQDICREKDPVLQEVLPGRKVACWLNDRAKGGK